MKTRLALVLVAAACTIASIGFAADKPGAKYTATGFLRISRQAPFILFPPTHQDSEQQFEMYKRTQRELVSSRFVLLAALRKPEVAKLLDVQTVQHVADAVRWLQSLVKVEFPGDAEIMTISVTTGDPQESATLARAVVGAYMSEVVDAERDQKRQRLNELDRAYVEKEMELRGKMEDLKRLAETLGVSDSTTLTLTQKLALKELYEYRKELRQLRAELRAFKRDLAVQKVLLQGTAEGERAPIDKEIKRLETVITLTTQQESEIKSVVERSEKETERFGRSVIDVEMMRTDIKNLEVVSGVIAQEREKLRVEVRSTPRVTAPFGRADVPENKD